MNKINYDKLMQEIISENKASCVKPRLLLHACCAPCMSGSIEKIKDYFFVTVYFFNPNMDTPSEYEKRWQEIERLSGEFNLSCIKEDFKEREYLDAVIGYENEPERGKRCEKCFNLRLDRTARFAKENGFDYFATTLTLSPLKNCDLINGIGSKLGEKYEIKYLPTDFKKRGGYLRSIELSKEYGLYRQNYCGCKFSKKKDD